MSAVRKKTAEIEEKPSQDSDEIRTELKTVSKKKIVYAEIDDEVTVLYDKIKNAQSKQIYVMVPKRSILFQSVVNLKILKRKAEDDNKKISFITNDKNGIHLAQQVGIPVYDKETSEGKPALFSTESTDEKMMITPLKASVNSFEEDAPTRLSEKKLSISEMLTRKKTGKILDTKKLSSVPEKKKNDKPKFKIIAPNRHALISLIVVSVFVLLVIVYIALPGVTIYVTPAASVLEKSVNITLADYNKNKSELETRPPHMIASYPIATTVKKTITRYSTGKKFSEKGSNSSGFITIYNQTNSPWPLIAQTRFQTSEGLVFRIPEGVTVPAATTAGPGSIKAFVNADILDAYGGVVGERGNIGPSKFFLPGLKDDSKAKISAESTEPMTGGVTDFISFVSKEDLDTARQAIKDELLKVALEELEEAVQAKSELVGEENGFSLLKGSDAVKLGEVKIVLDESLEGRDMKEFSISGEVYVSGVYYDHDSMLDILVQELEMKKSPQKELLRVNEDSTSYRIFEWNEAAGKIKLTANIKGIEQYSIDVDMENGQRLMEKIKEHIVGKDIEQAKNYIQNLPEINKVEIDSWPAWAPTIPNLPDNIEFEIRPAVDVQ